MTGPVGHLNIGSILSPEDVRASLAGKHICPFCGNVNETAQGACPRCRMEDTPATRKATKARIGPWHVRQSRNPSAPGMKFDTLILLVLKGQVTPTSIVRGPTTQQLWRFAANVKGLSREFGLCYGCGEGIERITSICPHCNRLQVPPLEVDALMEVEEVPFNKDRPIERPTRRPPTPPSETENTELATLRPALESQGGLLDEGQSPPTAAKPASAPAPAPESQRQTRIKPEGKILTPQDLAAAFRIGLKPDLNRRPLPSAAAPRKSHPIRNFVLTVLMLAVIGGGVLLYLRPDVREKTTEWANTKIESIRQYAMAKPAAPTPPRAPDNSRPFEFPEATRSSHVEPPVKPATQPAPQIARNKPQPIVEIKPPSPTPSARTGDAAVQPTTAPAPLAQLQTKKDPDVPPTPSELTSAIEHARSLWSTAIDAEQHRDYATAAKLYQQIKKLPEASWPRGLELRLTRVQKQLAQQD